ncbi:hypothetical protein [Candidatus Entotheonella palauensis]|uniref:hypothetical protein n=1 Tax=Candidatus Entotheonella palauensis TaxID=93172 RepID=UPI000B7DAA8C|nr:hypothetical protein [Candidatus Entotheonella palauensis]
MASPSRRRSKWTKRYHVFAYLRHAILLVWAAIVLFPTFWMISTSFKATGEWVTWPPHWLPHQPTLYNYKQIFAVSALGADLSREATDQVYSIWKAVGDGSIR